MKLAEALLNRAEAQRRLDALRGRVLANLKVQEGETPHEDPEALLKEADRLYVELAALIKQINVRNNETRLEDGRTLAEALTDREILIKQRSLLAAVASAASERELRLTHTEVKVLITIPVASVQKKIDAVSKEIRLLDGMIQSANWTVAL